MNKWTKTLALVISGILIIGTVVAPIQAAMGATEQQLEGANVLLDEYCSGVASGYVLPQTPELLLASIPSATPALSATAEPTAEPTAKPAEDSVKKDKNGHIKLNLNYSRLGIANKVDTYLNIRRKPSRSASIVGKLTKNAGCHIYKIKKGWAKIVSGGVNGWVKASYLTTDQKAEDLAAKVGRDCAEIQTDSLRVRALPTTDAPIYSVVSKGEEFRIKKKTLTLDFVKEIVKKEKISDDAMKRSGGYEAIEKNMGDFICIYVDNEYAFVAKEYVKEQYSLKRAASVRTVSSSKSSGVSSSQASIAEYAKQFLGNPYVWGGSSLTGGTDCSGFTMSLYRKYGHSLPHNAAIPSRAICSSTATEAALTMWRCILAAAW